MSKNIKVWNEYNYKGFIVRKTIDDKAYEAFDTTKILNQRHLIAGGASQEPEYTELYINQNLDIIVKTFEEQTDE